MFFFFIQTGAVKNPIVASQNYLIGCFNVASLAWRGMFWFVQYARQVGRKRICVFFYFFLHLCIYRYVCVKLSFASSARRSMLLDRPICETGRLLETLIQFQNRVGQTQPPTEEKQNLSVRYCHSSQDSFSSKLIIKIYSNVCYIDEN